MIENDNFIIGGHVGILDLGRIRTNGFLNFAAIPKLMANLTELALDIQPYTMKSFHYINVPKSFRSYFDILCGFMSDDNKSKVNKRTNN